MNAGVAHLTDRDRRLRPKLWYSLPPRIRRALRGQSTAAARILDFEATEELASEMPVPLERAKQEPAIGRMHTNGCFGARYDLRVKGLLIDCSQCDRSVTRAESAACSSRFCTAKF